MLCRGIIVAHLGSGKSSLLAITLDELNTTEKPDLLRRLSGIVENSPWVVETVLEQRPFASVNGFCDAIRDCLEGLPEDKKISLFRAHPELAGREAGEGSLTRFSSDEQARLGLLALSEADKLELDRLNAQFRRKFGFPFIVALHNKSDLASVFEALRQRLRCDPAEEIDAAVGEIAQVIRGRVLSRVVELPGPDTHGR